MARPILSLTKHLSLSRPVELIPMNAYEGEFVAIDGDLIYGAMENRTLFRTEFLSALLL